MIKRLKSIFASTDKATEQPMTHPVFGEIAESDLFSFISSVEYTNPDDLVGAKGIETYRKMYEQDPEIAGTHDEVILSVTGSGWHIKPVDESDLELEKAEFIEKNLIHLGGRNQSGLVFQTIENLLYEMALLPLRDGYGIWEKNWAKRSDGKVWIDSIKSKRAEDVEFQTDAYGNLLALTYQQQSGQATLDPGKFVLFPWLNVYQNWYGSSRYRRIYDCYYVSQIITRMAAQYSEKLAGGIIKGTYPHQKKQLYKNKLVTLLQKMSQSNVIAVPDDVVIDIMQASTNTGNFFNASISMLQKRIRRGLLGITTSAEGGETGDKAGQDSRDRSVKQPLIEFIGSQQERVINGQIIKEDIDYNWGVQEAYPEFRFNKRITADAAEASEVAVRFFNMGIDIPKTELEDKTGWRLTPEEGETFFNIHQIQEVQGAGGKGEATPAQLPDAVGPGGQFAELKPWQSRKSQVWRAQDAIEADATRDLSTSARKIEKTLQAQLERHYKTWLTDRTEFEKWKRGLNIPQQGNIDRSFNTLTKEAKRLSVNLSKQQIESAKQYQQANFQDLPPDAGSNYVIPDDFQQAAAGHWGYAYSESMQYAATKTFFDGLEAGMSRQQIADAFRENFKQYGGSGSDKLGEWWNLNRMVRNAQSEVFNKARMQMGASENAVIGWIYIAELDDRTTDLCRTLNGRKFAKNDPLLSIYYPPNHHQCRSFMDFLFAWEQPKQWDAYPDSLEPGEGFGGPA